jgi:two-component system sensor histidine kinase UhpB
MTPLPPPRGGEIPIRDQLAHLRTQQERLFAQLAQGQQHFKQLARSVWRVQEDERRRLARELHDGLGQNLTALKHQLEQLANAAGTDPAIAAPLRTALALCAETLEDTRELSRMLRPQILDDLGLEAALRWLGRTVAEAGRLTTEVDCAGLPHPLDEDVSTLLFRVAQEALTNVAKHAQASHVLVRAYVRDGQLHLLIADDGAGCDPDAALRRGSEGHSAGLGSMRERVALFGGQLTFQSERGSGTHVRVLLPYAEATATGRAGAAEGEGLAPRA